MALLIVLLSRVAARWWPGFALTLAAGVLFAFSAAGLAQQQPAQQEPPRRMHIAVVCEYSAMVEEIMVQQRFADIRRAVIDNMDGQCIVIGTAPNRREDV